MCKPYVLVKRPQPKRTKKQHLHRSVEARVLTKDNKRVQWEQRCTERRLAEEALSSGPIALFLHETDVVAGDEDAVFSLVYESYEGYTLYATQQGRCAVHGAGARGCLRLGGKYVSFLDEEQARRAVLYFQERGWKPHQIMERGMAEGAYVCLNEQRAVLV